MEADYLVPRVLLLDTYNTRASVCCYQVQKDVIMFVPPKLNAALAVVYQFPHIARALQ
jgi:hypothetical protein